MRAAELQSATELQERASGALDLLLGLVEAQSLIRETRSSGQGLIPLIIVSGFLGSGKTTLLRHILTASHGKSIAAIVNDFAALNVDAALIANVTADTVALENGCICCSISGSLARTLLAITERAERPDIIMIEASGVADPANIAQVAATLPDILLDSIVTVIDAASEGGDSELNGLHAQQVRNADIILINKIDLVSWQAADALAVAIRRVAPRATVLQTSHCTVPLALLLDVGHSGLEPISAGLNVNENAFQSVVINTGARLERAHFERLLSTLPEQVLRLKGFVRFAGEPDQIYLIQAVGRRWRLEAISSVPDRLGLVVIGLSDASFTAVMADHFSVCGGMEAC